MGEYFNRKLMPINFGFKKPNIKADELRKKPILSAWLGDTKIAPKEAMETGVIADYPRVDIKEFKEVKDGTNMDSKTSTEKSPVVALWQDTSKPQHNNTPLQEPRPKRVGRPRKSNRSKKRA